MKKQILHALFILFAVSLMAQNNSTTKPKPATSAVKKTTTKPVTKIPSKSGTKTTTTSKTKTTSTKTNKKMDTSTYVIITTDLGTMKLRLYDETPQHKANFIKIVQDGVLDSTLFHRVIPQFMIQGGDVNSKHAQPGQQLGTGNLPYTVPAEFNPKLIHKKGALAAARTGDFINPKKESSSTQFYIVQGKSYTPAELTMLGQRTGHGPWTEEQVKIYQENGGTPMLDMQYTVFGEVVEGFEVIDKIAAAQRDGADRPFTDIRMQVKIEKNGK